MKDPRERRNFSDRRKVERREPQRGSTVRIDDPDGHRPKRVKREDYRKSLLKTDGNQN